MTEHTLDQIDAFDVVILGAGPVGSTLALLLAGTRHRVLLLEQRSLDAGRQDPRALALSEGARQLLQPKNAWPQSTGQGDGRCTPIETIHISQNGGFGRTLIDRKDYRVPALGYVVRYGALIGFMVVTFGAAAIGSIATAENVKTWYPGLTKPTWTPPGSTACRACGSGSRSPPSFCSPRSDCAALAPPTDRPAHAIAPNL